MTLCPFFVVGVYGAVFNIIGFRLETSDWIDFNEEREQERRRIITTDRRYCPEQKISATPREDQYKVHHGRIKLDSHADTIVFAKLCGFGLHRERV